jgi:DNA-binding transcriptional regulator YiaG
MALNMALANVKDIPPIPTHGSQAAEEAVYEAIEFLRSSWKMSGSMLAKLLHLPVNTVNLWLSKRRVPIGSPPFDPRAEALLNLVAIHRSLHAMFSAPANQLAWLKTLHPELGFVPLEKIQESLSGLFLVRQYLDYVRGRGA